jgi:hypothetical protein
MYYTMVFKHPVGKTSHMVEYRNSPVKDGMRSAWSVWYRIVNKVENKVTGTEYRHGISQCSFNLYGSPFELLHGLAVADAADTPKPFFGTGLDEIGIGYRETRRIANDAIYAAHGTNQRLPLWTIFIHPTQVGFCSGVELISTIETGAVGALQDILLMEYGRFVRGIDILFCIIVTHGNSLLWLLSLLSLLWLLSLRSGPCGR